MTDDDDDDDDDDNTDIQHADEEMREEIHKPTPKLAGSSGFCFLLHRRSAPECDDGENQKRRKRHTLMFLFFPPFKTCNADPQTNTLSL